MTLLQQIDEKSKCCFPSATLILEALKTMCDSCNATD